MRVKGSVIVTIPEFVKETQGKEGLNLWLKSLDPEIRRIFTSNIRICRWYSLLTLVQGTHKVCRLFYHGSMDGALELGRYSSKKMLRNPVIKHFMSFGNLRRNIRKGSVVASKLYEGFKWELEDCGDETFILYFFNIPIEHKILLYRYLGWCEKGLEMNGTPVNINFVKNNKKGSFAMHIKPV